MLLWVGGVQVGVSSRRGRVEMLSHYSGQMDFHGFEAKEI